MTGSQPVPPRWVARAALALRRRLLHAADALLPPHLALFELGGGTAYTMLLHVAARLRLPDLLDEAPRTAGELARATRCDEDALFRALRALSARGVFRLRPDGRWENTRLSSAFRTAAPASMRDFLEYFGSAANVAAWADLARTVATGRNAFRRVHGACIWEWLAAHPADERTFAAAMVRLTELHAEAIAAGYAFGDLARICDIGGGHGALLAAILRRHPRARGVLFDAPQVVAGAAPLLEERGVTDRVACVGGDLFGPLPAGCDAYILKDVLHDWDDDAALRVLEACRHAAAPGGRALVVEVLLERGEAEPPGTLIDVHMMVATEGGRQRSAAEHRALLQRAGFRPRRVVELAGAMTLVEGAL